MNTTTKLAACAFALGAISPTLRADSFGSGANSFTIGFVNIGNAGNSDDAGAGGGIYSSPYGGVGYTYRMGVTEAAQDWITKATNLGMTNVTAGGSTANQPAVFMTWYEAAAFVNWLNTSTGHQAAYQINAAVTALTLWSSAQAWQAGGENLYRHKDAYYFLPSEDEWYKAAYHQNDGVTANYWDYATGSNTAPVGVSSGTASGTAVYDDPYGNPVPSTTADVNQAGGLSSYGTRGQGGNVFEWQESAADGANDLAGESRASRGGNFATAEDFLRSSVRSSGLTSGSDGVDGFRVASVVPEPSSTVLMIGSALMFLARRRR